LETELKWDPKLITDPDLNLQIISDPAGFESRFTTLLHFRKCNLLIGEADPVLTPRYEAGSAHYFVEKIIEELNPTDMMGEAKFSYVDYFQQRHGTRQVSLSVPPSPKRCCR
jgi:hypothetical protein